MAFVIPNEILWLLVGLVTLMAGFLAASAE
jgi:hypothetical protein